MRRVKLIAWLILAHLVATTANAGMLSGQTLLQRDRSYEEALRIQANPEEKITPLRVIRWLCSLTGQTQLSAPPTTEFQPVVNVYDGRVRVIGQLSYKF